MRLRRITAASTAAALAAVRRELGDDAHVLEARHLPGGGVEVVAAIDPPARRGLDDARRTMLAAGIDEKTTTELCREINVTSGAVGSAERDLLLVLEQRLASPPDPPCREGRRVIALIGPAGAGKTTTWAKLAARAALVQRKKVALVTLDTLRIGGVSQAETYSRLLGLPLHLADDLRGAHRSAMATASVDLVYVDTPGLSPRDGDAMHTLAYMLRALVPDEIHLLVPAGCTPATHAAMHARFAELRPDRVALTRVDEAGDASLLPAALAMPLPITYLTNGPTVPDDLEEITNRALVKRGLRPAAVAMDTTV